MAHSVEAEEQVYWDSWISNRDPEAGEQLMQLYMPLVHYHVQRIAVGLPRGVDADELKSHGLMGLFDALNKFDPGRDLKFDTYASFRIRGAILDGLRKEDWMPRSLREKVRKIDGATDRLQQEYMRPVTPKEVAEEIGYREEEVVAAQSESFLANVLSMDDDHSRDDGIMNISIEDKKTALPEKELMKEETIAHLTDTIKTLNQKEQLVISLFYYEGLTLTEIGRVLELSTSRISQIHSKALFRLKKVFASGDAGMLEWHYEKG
ncbi:MAG TPA: FliA/WhiG family RNA polymerase sigma factor [Bacillales bacterium]|nr:FliA/WhiG family RNA polymerase sigma factor [Bacillales bacterium]